MGGWVPRPGMNKIVVGMGWTLASCSRYVAESRGAEGSSEGRASEMARGAQCVEIPLVSWLWMRPDQVVK